MHKLTGIRIIDLSIHFPGSVNIMRLADLGAEVIKIEWQTNDNTKKKKSYLYFDDNRNKKKLCLNIKDKKDRQLAFELMCGADVAIGNFNHREMKQLGLHYDSIKMRNPEIIFCSFPDDKEYQLISVTSNDNMKNKTNNDCMYRQKDIRRYSMSHILGTYVTNEIILPAIHQREVTGNGLYVNVSLLDVLTSLMFEQFSMEKEIEEPYPVDLLANSIINYGRYETKDHRYVCLAGIEQKYWDHFCEGIKKEEWKSFYIMRTDTNPTIYEEVKKIFKTKTLDEWMKFSLEVDCCLLPILDLNDLPIYTHADKEKSLLKYGGISRLYSQTSTMNDHSGAIYKNENTILHFIYHSSPKKES